MQRKHERIYPEGYGNNKSAGALLTSRYPGWHMLAEPRGDLPPPPPGHLCIDDPKACVAFWGRLSDAVAVEPVSVQEGGRLATGVRGQLR
jgi:hypothetical protein